MFSNATSVQKLFFAKKIFLFDLDGTLYLGSKLIPGALELIHELRERGKTLFFFTNNSSRAESDYYSKLKKFGFYPKAGEVIMSTHTLISFLKNRRISRIFLLGTPAMRQMLERSGIHSVEKNPQVVVVGFDKTLTYEKLLKASRLVDGGLPYVVTHPDLFCPTDEGPEPDCGSFAHVIEDVTKRKPIAVLGKPNLAMLKEAMQRSGKCKKSDMILIGDRLHTDIEMGSKFGVETLLVLTGETKSKDLKKKKRLLKSRPSYVLRSVKELLPTRASE